MCVCVCVCVWQSPLAYDSAHFKRKCVFDHLYQLILLYNNSTHCYSVSWLGWSYIPNQLPNCLQQNTCAEANHATAGQKDPVSCTTLSDNYTLTRPNLWTVSCASWIESLHSRRVFWWCSLILSSSQRQILASSSFFSVVPSIILCKFLISVIYLLVPFTSSFILLLSWYLTPNRNIKLLILQSSTASYYFLFVRSRYSQHPRVRSVMLLP